MNNKLNEIALNIKNKIYSNLNNKEIAILNYTNLYKTIKSLIEQAGYDFNTVFNERCLIKNIKNIEDIRLYNIVQMYWLLIQIDSRLMEYGHLDFKVVAEREWSLVGKAELLQTITISKYGYFLDLSKLTSLDYIDIEEALKRLGEYVDGKSIKEIRIL